VRSSASGTAEYVSSGSELLLNDASLSDTGTYLCTASNSQGSVAAHVTVRVTGQLHTLSLSSGLYVVLASWCLLYFFYILSKKTERSIEMLVFLQHAFYF